MSHGYEVGEAGLERSTPEVLSMSFAAGHPPMAWLERTMRLLNTVIMVPCMVAVVAAAAILSYSVAARYFFKIPTEWQDETAVFLLMGATFFSGAFVQSYRGHVGVEAIASLLSDRVNHWRMLFVEVVSLAFCSFFAWKSWTLFLEALHEGHSSNSTWGPPMWIPYSLMSVGMTLLALQLLLEVLTRLLYRKVQA
jgi:TRAP-type C4-dicarboxylate transport system permease small subunit